MTLMRLAAAGILIFAALIVAFLTVTVRPEPAFAGRAVPSPVGTSGQFVAQMSSLGDKGQQLVLIEPEMHALAVYQIDAAGEVVLKSVRNFHWDLQMVEFNGTKPLPQDIRSQIEQR